MPRIRTVKPEMASDRKLTAVSRDARYTFVLLISQADDDGLLRAESRQLLGSLYPHDRDVSEDILERWLSELVEIGVLRWRQTRDGMRVAELVNWSRHQNIVNRSKPFLLTQLIGPTDTLAPFSIDPKEGVNRVSLGPSGAEPRVLSPESRVSVVATATNNGHSSGNGSTRASKPAKPPPRDAPTWVQEAAGIYATHIGIIPHGLVGRILKPVVDIRGWAEVRRVMEHFCAVAPFEEYLQRCEAGTLRQGEEKAKKMGYHTTLKALVERYTYWADKVGLA